VLVQVTQAAAAFVGANGGELWVWAARPRVCCAGSPAWMRAATAAPEGLSGFGAVPADLVPPGLRIWFRDAGGMQPEVLEIALAGRRHPKVAAYWDGCLMAMA
jgi:hypothetical protein